MNYVERNLRKGEEEIIRAKVSFWWVMPKVLQLIVFIVLAAVISGVLIPKIGLQGEAAEKVTMIFNLAVWIVCLLLAIVPLLIRIIVIKTTYLTVTNKRVVGKQGILRIQTLDVPVEKVDNVSFNAGIIGNLFHYYSLTIKSVGSEGWVFRAISNAQQFKDRVNDAIEKHAEQARKEQAEQIALAMHGGQNQ